jgi:hypothetical protein
MDFSIQQIVMEEWVFPELQALREPPEMMEQMVAVAPPD